MEKPIVVEQYADNGEFSHWHLIDPQTGCVMWSSFPEETEAQGQKIISFNAVLAERTAIAEKLKGDENYDVDQAFAFIGDWIGILILEFYLQMYLQNKKL